MAEKLLLCNLNLNGNSLKNVAVEVLASAPANPVAGQFYVNSTDGKFYYYNGTTWVAGAEYTASNKSSASGTIPVYDGVSGNDFQFRVLQGSGNLLVSESGGIITISINEANMAVSTAVESAISAAQAAAISAAATDATTKADAAQAAAEATAAAALASAVSDLEDADDAEEARATAAEAAAEAAAKAYADGLIAALDNSDAAVANQFVTQVSETDGVVSVQRARPTAGNVSFDSTNVQGSNASDVQGALEELFVASGAGASVTMTETTGQGDAGKTYAFYQGGNDASHKIGEINVPKDLVLQSGTIRTVNNVPHLILTLNDANSTEIDINLNDVFNDYAAGDSLDLSNRTFNVVVDTNSEAFLAIDGTSHRLKLSGVQSAINTAASAAQSAAETTAAADATSKANAAQAAAEATAAADATSKANAAEAAAKTYADQQIASAVGDIDNYEVNGVAISDSPVISGNVAQASSLAASSGVQITTPVPGSIKAFYNGAEVEVQIAYNGTVATVTWNGNYDLDIYYLATAVTMSAAASSN